MSDLHIILEELYEKANLPEEEREEYRERVGLDLLTFNLRMQTELGSTDAESDPEPVRDGEVFERWLGRRV